ncbi:MAG TPA: single-stranded-DNA-specific exonuclease RecJ [Candidatus Dependentiae bacterium]|nr:single-stranded-DNA-specific exonuclease RecJ [Candidatus Dependentiae bacterium]
MVDQIVQGEKYVWTLPSYNQQVVADIAATHNLSFPVAQTLCTRGFVSKDAIDEFLFGSFERDVVHPSQMKDVEKAVDRLLHAIEKKESILVFGDYDVDGVTSSAMMMICLLPLGAKINFFLPHRVRDGYGLSSKIVDRAGRNGYKVIVTVDNGITAFEPARNALKFGIDLIITDHHRPHDELPEAFAIINPNQKDCTYPFKELAGVGVTFKLLSLLYERKGLCLPPKVFELLLLGTIADVVPLNGENRFWVRYGLSFINKIESAAFKILKKNGKLAKPKISATDIGFSIAPQINALGRLEDPRQAVQFLIGTDSGQLQEVGKVLFELNEARKLVERSIIAEIEEQISDKKIDLSTENIIMAASKNWPPGVIGLVASRFVSKYGRPVLLFHIGDNGLAKGSCRSISAFNIFNALHDAQHLLKQFGGHSLAAGLSLTVDNLAKLKDYLEKLINQQLTPFDLQQKIKLDAQMSLADVNKKLYTDMEHLAPFGNKNEQPTFYVDNVVMVQKPVLLKGAHVKCGVFADGVIKPVIFFNRPELYDILLNYGQESFWLAARVTENHWNGRVTIELTGTDVAQQKEGIK